MATEKRELFRFMSDIILGLGVNADLGYQKKEMLITYAEGMTSGMLVKADGTLVATAADAADTYGILADVNLLNGVPEGTNVVGTKYPFVVVVRDATANFYCLQFGDGKAINDAAVKALEDRSIKVTKHWTGVFGKVEA